MYRYIILYFTKKLVLTFACIAQVFQSDEAKTKEGNVANEAFILFAHEVLLRHNTSVSIYTINID